MTCGESRTPVQMVFTMNLITDSSRYESHYTVTACILYGLYGCQGSITTANFGATLNSLCHWKGVRICSLEVLHIHMNVACTIQWETFARIKVHNFQDLAKFAKFSLRKVFSPKRHRRTLYCSCNSQLTEAPTSLSRIVIHNCEAHSTAPFK